MLRYERRDPRPFEVAAQNALRPCEGVLAALLYSRGVETAAQAEAFLHPNLNQLHAPARLGGMPEALALLAQAKAERWPTVVYGDYDVDGVCAAALMTEALTTYGIPATPHVPLRAEGYGLNLTAVDRLAGEFRLMVTVDLGITNATEIARAQSLGMRVIVTDHHQPGLAPCPADAVLNPLLNGYPFPRLCGTGVAFKLATALLGADTAAQWLDLAALATIADIVPLLDENRVLVAYGLPRIPDRPGLLSLMQVAGVQAPLTAEAIAYQLAPRLNAAGRIGDANAGVRLLLTRDPAQADALAQTLNAANTERKRLEADTAAEAAKQAETHDFVRHRMLFVRGDGWHTGVVGLVAGRLNHRYGVPVCALSREGDTLHGSLRGVRGVNLARCLQTCDDLLTRYGGHELAAGVTLPAENEPAFRERLERAVRMSAPDEAFVPAQKFDLTLTLPQADDALVDALAMLEPYGFGNPAPVFYTQNAQLMRRRAVGAQGAHLQLSLMQQGRLIDGIAFGMGAEAVRLPDAVDVAYTLVRETDLGRTSIKCHVQAITPSPAAQAQALRGAPDEPHHDALMRALLCELAAFPAPVAGNGTPDEELIRAVACDTPQAGQTENAALNPSVKSVESTAPTATATPPEPAAPTLTDPSQKPAALPATEPFQLPPEAEQLLTGRQGTLLIAFTRETACRWLQACGDRVELIHGAPNDPRCFHTLLVTPRLESLTGAWQNVLLLDGALTRNGEAYLRQRLPNASIRALANSQALRASAQAIDAGDDRYRALYRLLRCNAFASLLQTAQSAGLTQAQTLAGLTAFHALGLIDLCEIPFHYTLREPVRCSLSDSPVLGALRALQA